MRWGGGVEPTIEDSTRFCPSTVASIALLLGSGERGEQSRNHNFASNKAAFNGVSVWNQSVTSAIVVWSANDSWSHLQRTKEQEVDFCSMCKYETCSRWRLQTRNIRAHEKVYTNLVVQPWDQKCPKTADPGPDETITVIRRTDEVTDGDEG